MKTLVQGNAAWLKQGVETRVFVRVIDDSTSVELLCIGSAAVGTFDDLIDNGGAGVASTEIRHEGGMASVSGCTVRGLYLSERLPLCTEATVIPSVIGDYRIAGRFLSASGVSFAAARAAVSAEYADTRVLAGARDTTTSGAWTVWRAPLQYPIPAALSTCEDAYIELSGAGLYGSAQLWLVAGTWDLTDFITDATEVFNDFTGWAAGASAYSIAALNESWESSEYDTTVRLRLNQAGRDAVKAAAGGYLKLMVISENDRAGTEPSGDAFVQFTGGISPTLELRYNSVALENQIAQVYWSSDPTISNVALMERVWTGVVDSYEIDDRNVTLTLRQNDFKKDRVIPEDVITLADYPYCPEENVGKTIPVIYGDFITEYEHRSALGSILDENDASHRFGNGGFVKGYVTRNEYLTYLNALFAGHVIKSSNFIAALYETALESHVAVAALCSDILDGSDKTGQLKVEPGTIGAFPFDLPQYADAGTKIAAIACYIPSWLDAGLLVNPENATNADYTDWTDVTYNPVTGGSYQFYMPYGLSGMPDVFSIYFESDFPNGPENNKVEINIQVYRDNGTLVEQTATEYINANGAYIRRYANDPDVAIEGLANLLVSVVFLIRNKSSAYPFRFRNLCLVRSFNKEMPNVIYGKIQGRAFGTWIDTAGRSNSFNFTNLIENNAFAIEGIARNEMSLATAEIDTASFDAAATAITGMKAAFQLLDRKSAREILSDIALHARLKLWWDEQDRLTVKKFSSTAFFPNSGTDIPAALDRFTVTGSPSGGSFTEHPILSGPRVYRVEPDEVYNDFIVKYRRNYATGDFAGVLRVNKDSENVNDAYLSGTTGTALKTLCSDSYTAAHGRVNTLEVEAWSIRDEATATALIQHLVERMYLRRWMVEFTAGPSALMFEPADFINVRDALLEDRFGTAAMNTKKWEIIGYALDNDSFNVKIFAIEV